MNIKRKMKSYEGAIVKVTLQRQWKGAKRERASDSIEVAVCECVCQSSGVKRGVALSRYQ